MIYDIVKYIAFSFFGMLIVFPISFVDIAFVSEHKDGIIWWVLILHTIVIILSDTLAAFIGYSFSEKLKRLFVRKKKKNDIEKSHKRIEKWGTFGFYMFAASPLPITIAIYYAGAIKYKIRPFLIAVFFGRLTKYIIYSAAIYYGIEIIEYIKP